MNIHIVKANARFLPLADNSVQCVVTSPPYWGLRKYAGEQELTWNGDLRLVNGECRHEWATERYYTEQTAASTTAEAFSEPGEANKARLKAGRWREVSTCRSCGAWRGAFGLEPTIEMYVAHTVEILREVRRVLRPDGVCFWNIGDSYFSNPGNGRGGGERLQGGIPHYSGSNRKSQIANLKSKDLCLIPARVALAAQADGWWMRSDIIWAKPNPMPESCRDRPTDAYEHILMLTKSARYFWDAGAVAEPSMTDDIRRPYTSAGAWELDGRPEEQRHGGKPRGGVNAFRGQGHFREGVNGPANRAGRDMKEIGAGITRNLRNVWTFPTQPYKGAHFATFPEELVRRCIAAATSEKGACPKCGAPWIRIVDCNVRFEGGSGKALTGGGCSAWRGDRTVPSELRLRGGKHAGREEAESGEYDIRMGPVVESQTLGWKPGCSCPSPESPISGVRWTPSESPNRTRVPSPVPCVVLDPFAGSGTVGEVAYKMGRSAILIDLAYQDLQRERIPPLEFRTMNNEQ